VGVNLDGDEATEYVIAQSRHPQVNYVLDHDGAEGDWKAVGRLEIPPNLYDRDAWPTALAERRAHLVPAGYGDLKLDGETLRFSPLP
jgi:hypothetical protein